MKSLKPLDQACLYAFVDFAYLHGRKPEDLALQLSEGGADIIQLRAKSLHPSEILPVARKITDVLKRTPTIFIVNDHVDIALESGADGVHLGQDELEKNGPEGLKKISGLRLVGLSTHHLAQAVQAMSLPVDYIGVGPIFPTRTKPGRAAVGIELIGQVVADRRIGKPFFAIGGINLETIEEVRKAGAQRMAIVSAILQSPDPRGATRKFKQLLTGGN